MSSFDSAALDRTSFVPLYYQLQELLKQQIESGRFATGDALPSEHELCRQFGVSRIVVRQAIAILEDDRQVTRVRGKGTFVAPPKLDHRAGGLARLLARPRARDVQITTLDVSTPPVEESIARRLGADEEILRLTTLLSMRGLPVAITYSYFPRRRLAWLEQAAAVGRPLPDALALDANGIELAHADVSIETSQCGTFEAEQFGIPPRAAVFLVLATEYERVGASTVPLEVARVEYRGDVLKFRLELASEDGAALAAMLDFDEVRF